MKNDTQKAIDREFDHEAVLAKGKWAVIACALILLGLLWYGTTHAQTFTATVTSGQAPLSTVLNWSVPDAVTCTAGDTPGWRGSVPTSGTRTLTSIGIDMRLTLECVTRGSALLTWVHGAPVAGADVTAWRLLWGDNAATLTQTLDVAVPGATSFRIDAIVPGPKAFAVRALSGTRESVNSNVVTKDVAGGAWSQSIDITILPPPNPNPPVLTVTDVPTAFEIKKNSAGALVAARVGLVPIGTRCDATRQQKLGTLTYTLVPRDQVDMVNWPSTTKHLADVWARCG